MAFQAKTDWLLGQIVQPDDMNRIERGILDVDTNKGNRDLSNVDTSVFASKAKTSNIEVFDTAAKTIFVSPNGNDTTGVGTQASPFLTIQRAITAIPQNNPTGVDYTVNLMPGNHTGFELKSVKRIKFAIGNDVTINGDIKVYAGYVEIPRTIICTGEIIVEGGTLIIENVTLMASSTKMYAASASKGGVLNVTGHMNIVSGYSMNVIFTNTTGYIRQLTSALAVGTGISCRGGSVYVGTATLDSVPTKYSVSYGGRIFVGAQTITQE